MEAKTIPSDSVKSNCQTIDTFSLHVYQKLCQTHVNAFMQASEAGAQCFIMCPVYFYTFALSLLFVEFSINVEQMSFLFTEVSYRTNRRI